MAVQCANFLEDTEKFYQNYLKFCEFRINGLYDGARGSSRFVSAWITHVAQQNAKHELKQVQDNIARVAAYQGDASSYFKNSWVSYLPLKVQNWCFQAVQRFWPVNYQTINDKTSRHLKRAEEVLQRQVMISKFSDQTLHVPEHTEQFTRANACLEELKALQEQHPATFNQEIEVKKSWLHPVLMLSSSIVGLRVLAFGLNQNRNVMGSEVGESQLSREGVLNHMKELTQDEGTFAELRPSTKITVATFNQRTEDDSDYLHTQFLPLVGNMYGAYDKAKKRVHAPAEEEASPTFKELMEDLNCTFKKNPPKLK